MSTGSGSLGDMEVQVGDLIRFVRLTPTRYDDPRTTPEGLRQVFEALPKLRDLYRRMGRDRFVAACLKYGMSEQAAQRLTEGS